MDTYQYIAQLNQLITQLHNADKAHQRAVGQIKDETFQAYLREQALIRRRIGGELKGMVELLGWEAETGKTIEGDLLHGLKDLKAAISPASGERIFAGIEKGEERILALYTQLLNADTDLPESALRILEDQYADLAANLKYLRSLQERAMIPA